MASIKRELHYFPTQRLEMELNQEIPIKKLKINILDAPNEFDKDAIATQLINNKRVVVLGTLPGVGKSSACKHLETLGYNTILVCPSNELCNNMMDEWAITINTLFATGVNENAIMKKFDDEPYDVIIFDEIYKIDLFLQK